MEKINIYIIFLTLAHFLPFFFLLMLTNYVFGLKKKKTIYIPLGQLGILLTVLGTVYYHGNTLTMIAIKNSIAMMTDGLSMFVFDSLTYCMVALILFISSLVQIYSIDYMAHDSNQPKFVAYLVLFTAFMILLVISNNLLLLFIGWEGVGLSSFLLINFWSTRALAQKAALKALLVNRIGDLFLLYSFTLLYNQYETFDIRNIGCAITTPKTVITVFGMAGLDVACLFLVAGAAAKSAQLFLHTWLPDAMEGPTPVSALIHAATMVTAGVFIIIRCSPIIEHSNITLSVLTILGALTALFGSVVSFFQNDIKRIIAFSTTSQLGYMIVACGLSHYNLAFYHLLNHAFFKAALFLSAGVIIHALSDEQDIRRMGGLHIILPFTYVVMFWSSLSLCGFPFLSGYFSKHPIIDLAFASNANHKLIFTILVVSAVFTSLYSVKLILLVFVNKPKFSGASVLKYLFDAPFYMLISLICLVIPGIFFGYTFQYFFYDSSSLMYYLASPSRFDNARNFSVHPPLMATVLPLLPFFLLYFVFWGSADSRKSLNDILNTTTANDRIISFINFNVQRWGFDKIYNRIVFEVLDGAKYITEKLEQAFFNEVVIMQTINEELARWTRVYRIMVETGFPQFLIFVTYWAFFIFIIITCYKGVVELSTFFDSYFISFMLCILSYVKQVRQFLKKDAERKKKGE